MDSARERATTKQCELCQNVERVGEPDVERPETNTCFKARAFPDTYQPFKRSKTAIEVTCTRFSHIRTAVIRYRDGTQTTIHASAERSVPEALHQAHGSEED